MVLEEQVKRGGLGGVWQRQSALRIEDAVGDVGPQGAPGEVTLQQMNDAITSAVATAVQGTSANSNGVALIPFSAEPVYDQGQFQQMIDKVNELITALRR